MSRSRCFRIEVRPLEDRWLPSAGVYPDAARNALQASYVAQAEQADNPVVFLGDSITYNWGTADRTAPGSTVFAKDFAPLGAANFGVIGDTTSEVAARIQGGDLLGQPKVAVVLVGFNDLNYGATAAQASLGVASILDDIRQASPTTAIVLLGTLPTDDSAVNPRIEQLDAMLSRFADEPGVVYLNPGALLMGTQGAAQSDLLIDGVHPDLAGYHVIAGSIDGTIVKLLDEANYVADRPIPGVPSTKVATPPPSEPVAPVAEPAPVAASVASVAIPTFPVAAPTAPLTASLERSVAPSTPSSPVVVMAPAVEIPEIIEAPSATRSRSGSSIVGTILTS